MNAFTMRQDMLEGLKAPVKVHIFSKMLFQVVLNNNLLITTTSTKHSRTQIRQIIKSVTNVSAFIYILVYFLTEGLQTDNSNYFISINWRLSVSCWKSIELSSKNTLRLSLLQHVVYLQTREIKTLKINLLYHEETLKHRDGVHESLLLLVRTHFDCKLHDASCSI